MKSNITGVHSPKLATVQCQLLKLGLIDCDGLPYMFPHHENQTFIEKVTVFQNWVCRSPHSQFFGIPIFEIDKPKVVSRFQSQKLTTWCSLKLQCPNTPPPTHTHAHHTHQSTEKFQRSKIEIYFQNKSC